MQMYYLVLKSKYRPPWGQDVVLEFKTLAEAQAKANEARFYGGWRYINIRKSKPSNVEITKAQA